LEVPVHFKGVDTLPPSLKVLAVAKENKLLVNNETYQVAMGSAIRKIVLRSAIAFFVSAWLLQTFRATNQN
jgi:hypothetical protein